MTVCFSTRDRCRLCYTLAIRNRQKFYHLFKPIQRTRFIRKSILPYEYHSSKRTVCFQELLARYLHTNLQYDPTQPNSICSNCLKSLLDIEQCAKYLTKTINQLKRKFNKSNRLLASSLTAKFQLKRIGIKYEQLPLLNSDEDEEFDDIDDEDDDDDDDLVANNGNCHNEQSDGDDEDEDEEEEEEDGLVKTSTDSSHRTDLSVYPQSQPPFNLLNGADPQLFQMYMNQILRNSSTTNSNMDAMANTFNNMQRNIMKMFSQNPLPMNHFAPQIPPMSLLTSNTTKQNLTNSRKRKSIPEKRVITNNNGNIEQETSSNHSEYPLELTRKNVTTNGSPILTDEEPKESMISNDNSSQRRSTTKRARLSSTTQANDLLSLNQSNSFDDNQKQRKLDPRPCAECGKTLFNDKLHLLHCQTHAKNEKQCWICGIQDDDIKKHIINEHGNQKFTNTGFKCQHCDKVFPVFADLETHTKEHSKKKPFECPICHKRFGQQGNLSCHLRIHSGVKPFTCTSCGKAFRHSNSLRRHARTVHSANRSLTSSNVSLLSANPSLLSSTNEYKLDSFDEQNPSDLIIPSDDGSSSTGGPPSPSQIDSD